MMEFARVASLALVAALLVGGARDPGVLLELDRARFELEVRDRRGPSGVPSLRVVLGSPGHPTPTGSFPLYRVIRDPQWVPGELARSAGAERIPASPHGPMGAAKIPFAKGGVALHGGANPRLLGKPVSLGCVRSLDSDLLGLLAWLEERGALGSVHAGERGELYQEFRRPARLVVR
jgi:hypothetical protein